MFLLKEAINIHLLLLYRVFEHLCGKVNCENYPRPYVWCYWVPLGVTVCKILLCKPCYRFPWLTLTMHARFASLPCLSVNGVWVQQNALANDFLTFFSFCVLTLLYLRNPSQNTHNRPQGQESIVILFGFWAQARNQLGLFYPPTREWLLPKLYGRGIG